MHPARQQKGKGHLEATSEIRPFLILLWTQQAGDLRRPAPPHASSSLPLSRVSMPSERSLIPSFPIIPHLNAPTGPLSALSARPVLLGRIRTKNM